MKEATQEQELRKVLDGYAYGDNEKLLKTIGEFAAIAGKNQMYELAADLRHMQIDVYSTNQNKGK